MQTYRLSISKGRKFLFNLLKRLHHSQKSTRSTLNRPVEADTSENFDQMMKGIFGTILSGKKGLQKTGWSEIIWRNWAGKDGGDKEM